MDFIGMLITEETSAIDVLQKLDSTSRKVLFVVREGRLVATVSDGDVRRWILKRGSLEAPVSGFANYKPVVVSEENRCSAKEQMLKKNIVAIPVLDDEQHIVDVEFLYDTLNPDENGVKKINIPVVIMAGGLGTRLYPYTKILPKPLIPIGEIPICERIINLFEKAGCMEFYLVVNYRKNMIKAYFNELDKNYHITYIDEDTPLGTGGGLYMLKDILKNRFILTNCDTLIYEDYSKILQHHSDNCNFATMICSLKNYTIPYGVIELNENGSIREMKEKPKLSFLTNTGTYFVEPDIFQFIDEGENIGFPDVLIRAEKDQKKIGAYPISEQSWLDMGQFDSMETMKQRLEEIEQSH